MPNSNRTWKYRNQVAITIATMLGVGTSAAFAANAKVTSSEGDVQNLIHNENYLETYLDEAWITDIGTLLYSDADEDGYFSGLSLTIDADTKFSTYEVYATIYLIGKGYAAEIPDTDQSTSERLHTTRSFELYSDSISDEYRVDIELAQNYAPGTYDLQLALHDAHNDAVLDEVGAQDFRNLRSLSLESEEFHTVHVPVVDRPEDLVNEDIRVQEYAGSTGIGILIFLMMTLLFRRKACASSPNRYYTPRCEALMSSSIIHTECFPNVRVQAPTSGITC